MTSSVVRRGRRLQVRTYTGTSVHRQLSICSRSATNVSVADSGSTPCFLPVGHDQVFPGPAPGVLPPYRVVGDDVRIGHRPDRAQQLDLLIADGLGMEGRRRFHQEQREHLQDVILDDVADRARWLS